MLQIPMERNQTVDHVDLIMGEVTGKVEDRSTAPQTRLRKSLERSLKKIGRKMGNASRLLIRLRDVDEDSCTPFTCEQMLDKHEPAVDPRGEDPIGLTFGSEL